MAGDSIGINAGKGGKESASVSIHIEHADNVVINYGEVKKELDIPDKRKPSKEAKPIPQDELESLTSLALFNLGALFPNLVEVDHSKGVKMDPHHAGENLFRLGFRPEQVARTIYHLDSLTDLKKDKQLSVEFEDVILGVVNIHYPERGQIDVKHYFDTGRTLRN